PRRLCRHTHRAAIAGHHRDILLTIDAVGDRPGHDAAMSLERPEFLPLIGAISLELAAYRALEHEVARRRQRAAVPRPVALHFPDDLLRDRIISDQRALDHGVERLA